MFRLVFEIRPRFGLSSADAIDNEWRLIRDGFPELPFGLTQYEDVFPFASNEAEIFENPLQTYYRELEEDDMRMNLSISEPSSSFLRSSQSQSIPSDWLQDSLCSVRTEDVPLSEVNFMSDIEKLQSISRILTNEARWLFLTTFESSLIFWGSWASSQNRLELKT